MVFPWHTFWGGDRRDYPRNLSISHGPDPAGSHSLSEKEVKGMKVIRTPETEYFGLKWSLFELYKFRSESLEIALKVRIGIRPFFHLGIAFLRWVVGCQIIP